jgi:hypothetical protein
MVEEINEGFWISDYIQTQIDDNTELYKFFKKNIERSGYYRVKVKENPIAKIYTTELAMVLGGNEIDGINTFSYLESYSIAFSKGVEYFKENHLPTTKILYGEYAKLYVKDVHNNYFHNNHGNGFVGWNKVKSMYPCNLYINNIEDYGFYSGIVSEVDIVIEKYFELFKELDKGCDCEGFIQSQQTENKKESEKIKAPVLALFCKLINAIGIEQKDEIESVEKYCKRVCERYNLVYTDRVRQNFNGNETKVNLKLLTQNVLPLLDAETKSKIQKHLDTKQPPKQNLHT